MQVIGNSDKFQISDTSERQFLSLVNIIETQILISIIKWADLKGAKKKKKSNCDSLEQYYILFKFCVTKN